MQCMRVKGGARWLKFLYHPEATERIGDWGFPVGGGITGSGRVRGGRHAKLLQMKTSQVIFQLPGERINSSLWLKFLS